MTLLESKAMTQPSLIAIYGSQALREAKSEEAQRELFLLDVPTKAKSPVPRPGQLAVSPGERQTLNGLYRLHRSLCGRQLRNGDFGLEETMRSKISPPINQGNK